jgi:sulfatase modifying factor 1
MQQSLRLSRVVFTGAALAVLALACDSVLDIDDPKLRPGEAGASGAPDEAAGTSSGGSATPKGGEAGTPPVAVGGAGVGDDPGGAGGQAGTGEPHECEKDEIRCGGDASKTPQICDETFHFAFNNLEADADCPVLCDAGKCTECVNDEKRCSVCDEADTTCSTNQPQTCVDGRWQDDGNECANYCDAGECIIPTSCGASAGSRAKCDDAGQSCCRSFAVSGGAFKRDYDGGDFANDPTYPAQVSAFFLDKYEVTVGRMKQFVESYAQLDLHEGDGKSPHIPSDTGWRASLDLPQDQAALVTQLKCDGATWSDQEENIRLPVNCVPFNVAYAFCIWDGGRLPTETEWDFSAAGGDEQRAYPWKAPAEGPPFTEEYAYYYAADHLLPTTVGATPKGDGRWGQSDLAGNVSEWALDFYQDYSHELCDNCLELTASPARVRRGGSFLSVGEVLIVSFRDQAAPDSRLSDQGFRCARDP